MTLRTSLLLTAAVASLPLAYVVTSLTGSLRTADMTATLEHVVRVQINDQARERCESDPQWFLTGPLDGRPRIGTPKPTDPDAIAPRAKPAELPFELYAYDEAFTGSSTAAPRFPADIKNALRSGSTSKIGPFATPDGDGLQMGILTGWTGGPCAVWLARMRPEPSRAGSQRWLFVEAALLFFGAIVLGGWPLAERARRASRVARQVARGDYSAVVPASGRDEFTAVVASLNEASADVRRRIDDVKDREEAHRRFLGRVAEELVPPMEALESQLGDAAAIKKTHDIASHVANLVAGARLRMRAGLTAQDDVDLRDVVTSVARRHALLARASEVTIETSLPNEPIVLVGEAALFERALGNLVENAIENNRPGGHVNIRLATADAGKFSLRVIDDGRGMSDEQLTQLMAVRRFRGDEGKGSPGKRGLGLALVWEVAERSQLQVAIRQASGKGVAVEISGKTK
jgi:signal transduction histidine kinase